MRENNIQEIVFAPDMNEEEDSISDMSLQFIFHCISSSDVPDTFQPGPGDVNAPKIAGQYSLQVKY